MKLNLTKKAIDAIQLPETGQSLFYDTALPGFGLRATKTAKTFFAEGYLGRDQKRVKIGRYGVFSPDQAREEARQILAKLARGEDPSSKKGGNLTLEEAYRDMIALRTSGQGEQLKPGTVEGYDWLLNTCLADYKATRLSSINEPKVRAIHADLTKDRGAYAANNTLRLVRNVFNYATWAYPDMKGFGNPVECLSQQRLWNPESRRKRFIKSDNLAEWIERAEQLDGVQRGAVLLLLFMGIRREECYTLKKSDIGDACLVVRDTKNNIEHHAPMGPYLWARIKPLLKLEGKWLFPSDRSKTGHIVDMRKALAKLGERVSPHDLRRTFVSHLNALEPAPSTYTIKRLMNHYAEWDDVTAGYIQHEEKKLREVITRLELQMLTPLAAQVL